MNPLFLKIASTIASVDLQAARKSRSKKKSKKARKQKKVPSRVSRPKREMIMEDISVPKTEYSANMDISLSVNFEGQVDKQILMDKFKRELIASIESGVSMTARSLDLAASNLRVKPLKMNFVVNDTLSLGEDDIEL